MTSIRTFRYSCVVACLLLFAAKGSAQPYFFLTHEPENRNYYLPGDTLRAVLTLMEDGSLGKMRVLTAIDSAVVADLIPLLTLTDHYPPVKEFQLALLIPTEFTHKDSVFVFEVATSKYGTQTLEFKLLSDKAGVNDDAAAATFMLFPNPARQSVAIPLQVSLYSDASVMSIDGKLITSFAIDNLAKELVVDVSALAAGEYMVILRGTSATATGRLIVR